MAISWHSGVPLSVHKNGEKIHFWNQIIAILEVVEVKSHTVPQNDGKIVYYLEPEIIFGISNYLISRAI